MGEQEYYVQINRNLWNNLNPLQLGGVGIDLCPSEQYFIAEYEPESSYAKVNKNSFTKSELAEIMDGALYKSADYCEFMELPPDWVMNDKTDRWLCEWINPLIKLVPVEDDE